MKKVDVAIVGGGLSGLACAYWLQKMGKTVRLLEADTAVGGRVRTDVVDGFRLDRGFQVLLDAYPEAKRILDYDALRLRSFVPGAQIRVAGRFHEFADPFRHPQSVASTLLSPVGTLADKMRLASLRQMWGGELSDGPPLSDPRPTAEFLIDYGFGPAIIKHFFRPFYGGVFLEQELNSAAGMFAFTFDMFAHGHACVPALGMEQIPKQIAAKLAPETVELKHAVRGLQEGRALDQSGRKIDADVTVLATDQSTTARFLGQQTESKWRGTRCFYFRAPEAPTRTPILYLNGDETGILSSAHVVTALSPEAGPHAAAPNDALISATVKGDAETEESLTEAVANELSVWFGKPAREWKLLRDYHIAESLPGSASTAPGQAPGFQAIDSSLFVCGDHLGGASINGALRSGRLLAERLAQP